MSGVRVDLSVRRPAICPLTNLEGDTRHESLGRNRSRENGSIEEFVTPVSAPEGEDDAIDFERVFSYDSKHVFRFEVSDNVNCPRDSLEQHECVLLDCYVENNTVHMSFHASSVESLGEIVQSLKDEHNGVSVDRILRTSDESGDDLVVFDRSQLTERQLEVLETASEMGYFDRPRGANAEEVAEELDIVPSTFSEHLGAAQRKLLSSLLERTA